MYIFHSKCPFAEPFKGWTACRAQGDSHPLCKENAAAAPPFQDPLSSAICTALRRARAAFRGGRRACRGCCLTATASRTNPVSSCCSRTSSARLDALRWSLPSCRSTASWRATLWPPMREPGAAARMASTPLGRWTRRAVGCRAISRSSSLLLDESAEAGKQAGSSAGMRLRRGLQAQDASHGVGPRGPVLPGAGEHAPESPSEPLSASGSPSWLASGTSWCSAAGGGISSRTWRWRHVGAHTCCCRGQHLLDASVAMFVRSRQRASPAPSEPSVLDGRPPIMPPAASVGGGEASPTSAASTEGAVSGTIAEAVTQPAMDSSSVRLLHRGACRKPQ